MGMLRPILVVVLVLSGCRGPSPFEEALSDHRDTQFTSTYITYAEAAEIREQSASHSARGDLAGVHVSGIVGAPSGGYSFDSEARIDGQTIYVTVAPTGYPGGIHITTYYEYEILIDELPRGRYDIELTEIAADTEQTFRFDDVEVGVPEF